MCLYAESKNVTRGVTGSLVAILLIGASSVLYADQEQPWLDDPEAIARQIEFDKYLQRMSEDEMHRLRHHPEVPDTMYASTPSLTSEPLTQACPVPHVGDVDGIIAAITRKPNQSLRLEPVSKTSAGLGFDRTTPFNNRTRSHTQRLISELASPNGYFNRHGIGVPVTDQAGHGINRRIEILHVPLVFSGSNSNYQSLVRVFNQSNRGGIVTVIAVDDIGQYKEPINLAIRQHETIQLTAADLEQGNARLGIARGIGIGVGNWRLEVVGTSALEVSSYVRTSDGLLVSMHDTVSRYGDQYHVPTFFPRDDAARLSSLRLINISDRSVDVRIEGFGEHGGFHGQATVPIAAGASTAISLNELEVPNEVVDGVWKTNSAQRHLRLTADAEIQVMNLVTSSSGHITNLSKVTELHESENITQMLPSSLTEYNGRKSFIRIVNRSENAGTISIVVRDGSLREYPPIQLTMNGMGTLQFGASDLENGNPSIGISHGTGLDLDDFHLSISSSLNLAVSSYEQSDDGFVVLRDEFKAEEIPLSGTEIFGWSPGTGLDNMLTVRNPHLQPVKLEVVLSHSVTGTQGIQIELGSRQSSILTHRELNAPNLRATRTFNESGQSTNRVTIKSDQEIRLQSIVVGSDGRVSYLSPTPLIQTQAITQNDDDQKDVTKFFGENIIQWVRARCMECHVEGGRSEHTRLVFVKINDAENEERANLKVFRDFLAEVENGAEVMLDRVQGIYHGGGVQFPANSAEFKDLVEFLNLMSNENEEEQEQTTDPIDIQAERLVEHISIESEARTLWRAALVLAGRIPTSEEYSLIQTSENGLRSAIRGLMEGQGFHDFIIRSANDQLLTDRDKRVFDRYGLYVDYTNRYYELSKAASESGNYREFDSWWQRTHFGVRREGLELIAHVVQNDLPYTEILTADYVMANPYTAESYASATDFDDFDDAFEFRKSDIFSYYRKCAGRAVRDTDFGPLITAKGKCPTDLPLAGILTNKTFLLRYPTTATNRNRARSRWTYYHFLDVDIENSASRTTDPVALADTNNPTMKNGACTVCHAALDPVAGAFQDYGEDGDFWDEWGGQDSLDFNYVISHTLPRLDVIARTYEEREIVSITERLTAGTNEVQLAVAYDHGKKWSNLAIDYLVVRDEQDQEVAKYEIEDLDYVINDRCGSDLVSGDPAVAYAYQLNSSVNYSRRQKCAIVVNVSVPRDGIYTLGASVWVVDQSPDAEGEPGQFVMTPEMFYRDGDTWYRDMRSPGYGEHLAPEEESSIQWLAKQITSDEGFSSATVKFWWPAIMGHKVEEIPTNRDLPDFNEIVVGLTAQRNLVEELALGFREGFGDGEPYNLRDLLTEMVLSPWFRGNGFGVEAKEINPVTLKTVGANRLLTPEELARKTAAVTGFQWGRMRDERVWRWPEDYQTNALDAQYMYKLLYGGIDSDGIIDRARDMTAVMAGVAKTHAVESSCPIIMREFFLLDDDRRYLFSGIDKWTAPDFEFGNSFEITATNVLEVQSVELLGHLPSGDITIAMAFLNDYHRPSARKDRNIRIEDIRIKDINGEVVASFTLEDDPIEFFNSGDCNLLQNGRLNFFCEGLAELTVSIQTPGIYRIEVDTWADQAGDDEPMLFLSANSDVTNSVGSRAIKEKLVELNERLFGVVLSPESEEVSNRYDLLVDLWHLNKYRGMTFNEGKACSHWSDYRFLEGVVDEPFIVDYNDQHGVLYRRNNSAWNKLNQATDWSDPRAVATTWMVVLTSFLLDYDYLHL